MGKLLYAKIICPGKKESRLFWGKNKIIKIKVELDAQLRPRLCCTAVILHKTWSMLFMSH